MLLKYFAFVPDTTEATQYYKDIMNAVVVKGGKSGSHTKLKLFGEIIFYLYDEKETKDKQGYLVIKFEDYERSLYEKALNTLRSFKDQITVVSDTVRPWGGKTFQFIDKYGYTWILERQANEHEMKQLKS